MAKGDILDSVVPEVADASNTSELTVATDPAAGTVPIAARNRSALGKVIDQEWAPAILFLLFDVTSWGIIYGAIVYARHDQSFSGPFDFAVVELVQLAVIVQALFIIGGYSHRTDMLGLAYTAEHILAMITSLGVSALILYTAATFDHSMRPGRGSVLASFILFTPVSLLYRRALRSRMTAASATRAFLVLGSGELAADFYRTYRASASNQRLEFVDLEGKNAGQRIAGPGSPIIQGDFSDKLDVLSKRYSGIILTENIDRIRPELLNRLIRTQFQWARVYTLESFYEAHWRQVPVHSVDPFWPIQVGFQLSRTSPYHYAKRIFDMIAAVIGLLLASPLMAMIALTILITSGRPIIFRQRRVGRDEVVFTAYKFRTMREGEGDSALTGEIYTRENDPRILPFGRWLRKIRLDELPQLWNVLTGELSLIGPRAEWVECANRYRETIPYYYFRHLVKPGITGWAQVNYPYGESEEDAMEKLTYDLYYIRHYSLKLDAMIVLKTIHTMLFGGGR
jgi:exopolysaccharide biosynthesis polyprenyl glycosylphosphotransferase